MILEISLPESLDEMLALPEAQLHSPEKVAGLTVAALNVYAKNKEECFKMLDYLRGPRPLSNFEKQFIRDRFMDGHDYIPKAYLYGASPQNNYQPELPARIELKPSASQIAEEGYRKYDVYSLGADTPRPVTLRYKPSTDQWFLWEQSLLVQVKTPVKDDPWA
ncbi:MAG: hypothetical protein IKG08_01345 [Eubacterium sp.]|nr:hypothetical protein [Eubacterium sp.]